MPVDIIIMSCKICSIFSFEYIFTSGYYRLRGLKAVFTTNKSSERGSTHPTMSMHIQNYF